MIRLTKKEYVLSTSLERSLTLERLSPGVAEDTGAFEKGLQTSAEGCTHRERGTEVKSLGICSGQSVGSRCHQKLGAGM